MFIVAALIFVAMLALATPTYYGGEGANANFNLLEHGFDTIVSPTITIGTAAAEIPLVVDSNNDIVVYEAYAVVAVVGGGTGAAGSFKLGYTDGAASPTADDDAIAAATTVSHVTATAPLSSKIPVTLVTTLAPAVGTDRHKAYGPRPIVAAGKTIIVTTVQGASGVTQYRVVLHVRRIGKAPA